MLLEQRFVSATDKLYFSFFTHFSLPGLSCDERTRQVLFMCPGAGDHQHTRPQRLGGSQSLEGRGGEVAGARTRPRVLAFALMASAFDVGALVPTSFFFQTRT